MVSKVFAEDGVVGEDMMESGPLTSSFAKNSVYRKSVEAEQIYWDASFIGKRY